MTEKFLLEAILAVAEDLRSGYSDDVAQRIAAVLERIVLTAHKLDEADFVDSQAAFQEAWWVGQD